MLKFREIGFDWVQGGQRRCCHISGDQSGFPSNLLPPVHQSALVWHLFPLVLAHREFSGLPTAPTL
jgi:hypothetical protein